jgi:F0F1-type ATP synthase assembly protein I
MADDSSSNGTRAPVGLMLAGSEMVTFTLLGLLIDYLAGTMPWFTVTLTLLGVVAAFFQLLAVAKVLSKKKPKS